AWRAAPRFVLAFHPGGHAPRVAWTVYHMLTLHTHGRESMRTSIEIDDLMSRPRRACSTVRQIALRLLSKG
ncbi:MAG TPA: hypothetical protein VFV80_05665, partial [Geminicoccaceae bacterium]|nr:hypothetical protein [Geminicoccaceae bacterium]